MFRRSPSRPHPRLFRSSSSPRRNHQRKGCVFACIGALLLLSTVAFLHAKRGSPQAAQHYPSDNVNFHRRSAIDVPRDGGQERDGLGSKTYDTLRKGFEAGLEVSDSDVDEHNVKSFYKEANTYDSKAVGQLDERKEGNDSLVYRQEDYDNDEDEDDDDNNDEKLDLDTETDVELDTDEMDDLEDPADIAAEELDDMDEDDGSEEEEANGQVADMEKLERKEGEINEELEKETRPGHQDTGNLLAAVTGNGNTLEVHDGQEISSGNYPQQNAENTLHERKTATEHTSSNGFQEAAHATKALERLGAVKTVPRWDPLENLGNVGLDNSARDARRSSVQGYEMDVSLRNDGIIWDHLLGVARHRTGNIKYPSIARKFELGAAADEISKLESLSAAVRERQGGFSNGSSSGSTQVFSSDDEPLDEVIRERLEEITAIEDALLLRTSKGDANKKERSGKAPFDPLNPTNNPLLQDPDTFGPNGLTKSDKAIWKAIRKASVEKTAFLQEKLGKVDDTSPTEKESVSTPESNEALAGQLDSGANVAERSILGVLTKSRNLNSWNLNTEKTDLQQQSKFVTMVDPRTSIEMKGGVNPTKLSQDQGEETLLTSLLNNPVNVLFHKEEADIAAPKLRNNEESEQQMAEYSDIKYLKLQKPTEIRASDSQMGVVHQLQHMDSEPLRAVEMTMQREAGSGKMENFHKKHHLAGGSRKWGFFPGIDPFSSFSEFLEQFLMDSRCSLRVFMAWTTSPWTYTVRYQRGLESLLHFHSQACVVVFSESIELNFFTSFVEDGFRVAVVVPNLEELLKGTPADVFASIWLTWRKTDLFHIHYTELLRLAALYKYGGIYIDTDVIILKPLDILHNTVGAENIENHRQRMNGAVMAFDKFSPFLLECLAEFTATYDDRLVEFNGAELLTRVADRTAGEQNKKLEQLSGVLNIKLPRAFFPLSSENIITYFMAPVNQQQDWEHDQILKMILKQSLAVHFWNQRTSRLVPEDGSLIERIINHYCIRCNEYI